MKLASRNAEMLITIPAMATSTPLFLFLFWENPIMESTNPRTAAGIERNGARLGTKAYTIANIASASPAMAMVHSIVAERRLGKTFGRGFLPAVKCLTGSKVYLGIPSRPHSPRSAEVAVDDPSLLLRGFGGGEEVGVGDGGETVGEELGHVGDGGCRTF